MPKDINTINHPQKDSKQEESNDQTSNNNNNNTSPELPPNRFISLTKILEGLEKSNAFKIFGRVDLSVEQKATQQKVSGLEAVVDLVNWMKNRVSKIFELNLSGNYISQQESVRTYNTHDSTYNSLVAIQAPEHK